MSADIEDVLDEARAGKTVHPLYLLWGEEYLVRRGADDLVKALLPDASAGVNFAGLGAVVGGGQGGAGSRPGIPRAEEGPRQRAGQGARGVDGGQAQGGRAAAARPGGAGGVGRGQVGSGCSGGSVGGGVEGRAERRAGGGGPALPQGSGRFLPRGAH